MTNFNFFLLCAAFLCSLRIFGFLQQKTFLKTRPGFFEHTYLLRHFWYQNETKQNQKLIFCFIQKPYFLEAVSPIFILLV